MENLYVDSEARSELYVKGFHPEQYLKCVPDENGTLGDAYLTADIRKFWFLLIHSDGKIVTELLERTDQLAVVKAKVFAERTDPDGAQLAEGTAIRFSSEDADKPYAKNTVDWAETIAISRALANAGFDIPAALMMKSPADGVTPTDGTTPANSAGGPVPPHPYSPLTAPPDGDDAASPAALSAQPAAPAPNATRTQAGGPPLTVQKPTVKSEEELIRETLLTMTPEDAKALVVSFGIHKGETLGQIALTDPGDLQFYIKKYRGSDLMVKAGARLLLDTALNAAG